ncbi:MAG: beta-galactosidase/beta-glucuronidase, partial [Clostridiales bacterium]|nr:beta-galactosidase/beta-glucuronidase [Clostridiales bacterium]
MDICLGGKWKLYFDSERELDFNTYTEGTSMEVEVPGTVDKYLEDRTYSGPFFYNRLFWINKDESKRFVLGFKGVSYYCQISLNGKLVGEHEGIWDEFSFDITEFLLNGENSITVKVIKPDFDKSSRYYFRSVLFGFIPDVLLPFGGIWKSVNILEKNKAYFEEVHPKFNMKDETLEIEYVINNRKDCSIQVDVVDPKGRVNYFFLEQNNGLFKIEMDNLMLWSPDEPNLYTIEIKLLSNGVVLDSYKKPIGARSIESKDGKILVNGKPIYLRGVLHWGYYPEAYSPNPAYETVKKELLQIKDMGFNGVKHCLYFPPEYYYELCDEMGI